MAERQDGPDLRGSARPWTKPAIRPQCGGANDELRKIRVLHMTTVQSGGYRRRSAGEITAQRFVTGGWRSAYWRWALGITWRVTRLPFTP